MKDYDFAGWATKNNLKCSDGRTIMKDAFKHNDGQKVPLVWNHQHNDPLTVLGYALLENRDEGVYAYGYFNDTALAQEVKKQVMHGDITQLSIYANKLKQNGGNVMHGTIREVSLVLASANPGAFIDSVMSHGEESEEEAVIYTGEDISLLHSDEEVEETKKEKENIKMEEKDEKKVEKTEEAKEGRTVKEIYDSWSEEEKDVVHYLVGVAIEEEQNKKEENKKGEEDMKHNVFQNDEMEKDGVISHSEMIAVVNDAKRYGSMRESAIAHGISDIETLFPYMPEDGKNVTSVPGFIQREMGWVKYVMNAVHKTPFSRVKSTFANITEEDARAKGYIKGKLKKDEVFTLLKRATVPTTVYKKQKLDRDDVVDITDFDVVAWIKSEMRMMLDEELARAFLVGDGRNPSSDDKINEINIRPIWTDNELYTIKKLVEVKAGEDKAKAFIRAAVKARKDYKGSGSPCLFASEDVITDCLLLEDTNGRVIYETVEKLANALRVKEIISVPVMEGLTREDSVNGEVALMGIIVNLADYNVGADKGGAVNMFDDFDIDYNAMKYLIETRCSGALIKPYSAIALEVKTEVAAG